MNTHPARILLVEDEAAHVVLIRRAFEPHAAQFHLSVAESLEEARTSIARSQPNLVIADLRLPGIGGAELVQRMRHTLPDLRVLVMSALRGVDLEQSMAGLEGAVFLAKPFSPLELEQKVRQALERN